MYSTLSQESLCHSMSQQETHVLDSAQDSPPYLTFQSSRSRMNRRRPGRYWMATVSQLMYVHVVFIAVVFRAQRAVVLFPLDSGCSSLHDCRTLQGTFHSQQKSSRKDQQWTSRSNNRVDHFVFSNVRMTVCPVLVNTTMNVEQDTILHYCFREDKT